MKFLSFFFALALMGAANVQAEPAFWNMSRHKVYISLGYTGNNISHSEGWREVNGGGGRVAMPETKTVNFGNQNHVLRLTGIQAMARKPNDYLGVHPSAQGGSLRFLMVFAPAPFQTTFSGIGQAAAQATLNWFNQNQPGHNMVMGEYSRLDDWKHYMTSNTYLHGIGSGSYAERELNRFFN